MTPDAVLAVLIVAGLVVLELIRLAVRYFFRRFTDPGYVTSEDCKTCSDTKEMALTGLRDELRAVKKLLFVVALKVGVEEAEVKTLVG